MRNLRELDLVERSRNRCVAWAKPFLGICLGMELLAIESYEAGHHRGLGWLDAVAEPVNIDDPSVKTIHIG